MSTSLVDSDLFFLVGAVRSGTTLVRLLLGNHSKICDCKELEYIAPYIRDLAEFPKTSKSYLEYLNVEKGFRMDGYSVDPEASFIETVNGFFKQRQETDGCPIVGAVVHNEFGELFRVWPNAKYIYMHRDPRDVAASCVQMGWHGNNWGGAKIWNRAHDEWLSLKPKLTSEQMYEFKYEDLIGDTEKTLAHLCTFLGVEYEENMLNIEGKTTYKRPNSAVGKTWKKNSSDSDIMQAESAIGKRIYDTPYEKSSLPELTTSTFTLELEDRIGRIRFNYRRFGVYLATIHYVFKFLPLKSINNAIRIRMQDIEITHHK